MPRPHHSHVSRNGRRNTFNRKKVSSWAVNIIVVSRNNEGCWHTSNRSPHAQHVIHLHNPKQARFRQMPRGRLTYPTRKIERCRRAYPVPCATSVGARHPHPLHTASFGLCPFFRPYHHQQLRSCSPPSCRGCIPSSWLWSRLPFEIPCRRQPRQCAGFLTWGTHRSSTSWHSSC